MSTWDKTHPLGSLLGDPIPGAPALAARGDTAVGVRTLTLSQPSQADVLSGLKDGAYPRYDRPLQVEVWYPASAAAGDARAVYTDHMGRVDLGNLQPYAIEGRAFRDAAPDPAAGACPVILLSHGYPGSRFLLVNLAENLSSKGYAVFSIGHTDNTYEDFAASGSLESALIHRSLDQRFLLSELPRLNEEGFLQGMLQPENVGLVGFSMGGYGALRTIGARLNGKTLEQAAPYAAELAEETGYRGVKTVRAAVLFAPATFFLDEDRTGDIDIPTLWLCGSADHVVHYDQVRRFCEKADRSDRVLVSYAGCGHNVANNPAPAEAYSQPWEIFKRWSDPVWDTLRLNNANCHFLTAFFGLHLRGDSAMSDFLQPAAALKGFTEGTDAGIRLEAFPANRS